MINLDAKLTFLKSILGSCSYSSNTKEALFYCPFCPHGHHKKKMSINIDNDYYQCWVCGAKGRTLTAIIRKVGNKSDLDRYFAEFSVKKQKKFQNNDKTDIIRPELPKEFVSIMSYKDHLLGKKAYDYLTKTRKITDRDIIRHKIGTCFEGEYANRIVFPSFDRLGLVNFYTSRTYEGKYYSPQMPKGYKSEIILNELNIDFKKPLTIVEGFGDLLKANDNCTPLLGSSLLEGSLLFDTIVENETPIYLGLDPDAFEKEMEIAKSFMKYDIPVFDIEVKPFKDIGEMSFDQFMEKYESAKQIDNNQILRERFRAL